MKALLDIEKPNSVKATISLTLTLEQWIELKGQLKDAPLYGASGELKDAVNQLIMKLCSTIGYYPEAEKLT